MEDRLPFEPVDPHTPEAVYDRQWVAAVLGRCLRALRDEHAAPGERERFERLRPFLVGDEDRTGYGPAARALGLTEAAVRVAVHRLRKRFGTGAAGGGGAHRGQPG
jgi:hypothetical protein